MTSIGKSTRVSVVGAGLAGSECALQLADLGYQVDLYEMRGLTMTPAHKTAKFAELVCSNSFGSASEGSAPALLKWEAEHLNSHILQSAREARVPAGQALAVDREIFADLISKKVRANANIKIHEQTVTSLSQVGRPAVIATGPLTHDELALDMKNHFGDEFCYFFDAIAPIIDADSINMDIAWFADRYDKGTPDYINCPLNPEQYFKLIQEIQSARKIEPKHFETTSFFEGCMPIEVMVERGPQTLRFGPLKPVGLIQPGHDRHPYAVVQLRKENLEGTSYNMVGFQTRMAYGEQERVLRMIPGLENAEFLKLGSMHRNLFINSPMRLNPDLSSKKDPWLFFAGQITGVEGYFESTCMGLLVAKFIDDKLNLVAADPSQNAWPNQYDLPPRESGMGSLLHAITAPERAKHFQPTNINYGLLPPLAEQIRDKSAKKSKQIEIAKAAFLNWLGTDFRPQNLNSTPVLQETLQ